MSKEELEELSDEEWAARFQELQWIRQEEAKRQRAMQG
jgi:hypothetical protein